MYNNWDLTPLYKGVDDEFKQDLEKITTLASELKPIADSIGVTNDLDLIKNYLLHLESLTLLAGKMQEYLFLRRAVNTKDGEAVSYSGRISSVLSDCSGYTAITEKYIGRIENLQELIDKDSLLKEYEYLLTSMKKSAKYVLGGKEETIISKFNMSGGSAWEDMRDYLTSSVAVDYKGEKTNLSDIRNLAYDDDKETRRSAYEAELACYDKIKDAVAFSLNGIKLQTINECKVRGYESPLQATLFKSRMERSTLDALISAMDEYMPVFRKYLKAKAKALGYTNGLPWYELFAPMGKMSASFTPQDAHKYLLEVFSAFDQEEAELIDTAFKNEWIDFFPRDGKTGGAFDMGIHAIGQSRVMTNFGGKFTDVMTLAHELGHSFHDYNVKGHRPLNTDYSMPVAETASNFNEVITMDYALKHASSKEEKLALLEGKLQDTTQIVCDIYSRYLFETAVFASREDDFMFPDKLCEMMLDAQRKSYGDGLDESCMHPYMWLCKGHYYSASLPFYNFPYAFGGLFAQGLFAKYQSEGKSFVPLYKKLLNATTVSSVEDTAKIAGIDLSDKNFWKSGLDCFAEMIDEFVSLAEE